MDPHQTFPRHPFEGARSIVEGATRWGRLVGCLLFALIAVGILAGVAVTIAATIAFDLPSYYVGPSALIFTILSAIPWVTHMVLQSRKKRAILDSIMCPGCGSETTLSIDGSTNAYVLICQRCRVIWVTPLFGPGSGDDTHHHHT